MNDPENSPPLILFVDDEATAVKYFQRAIDSMATVVTACSVDDGKLLLDQHAATLMVLVSDQRMPGGYGNALLQYARERHPHIVRILTTAYSEIEHTVEAVNQGQIHRYIQKPWDISALRMELKQALEWATLRRDHAELLQEKLAVQQKQIIANRIGTIHTLGASLASTAQANPAANYLIAAATAGVKPAEPDWLRTDYADAIGDEAVRSGQFGHALAASLAEITLRYGDRPGEQGLAVLAAMIDGAQAGDGSVTMPERTVFSEFLETPAGTLVSARHVAWLACLLWLHERGWAVQVSATAGGAMQCHLQPLNPRLSEAQAGASIAAWVEHFCLG